MKVPAIRRFGGRMGTAAVASLTAATCVALLSGCQNRVGTGPITLKGQAAYAYSAYRSETNPSEFYVSEDGNYGAYSYCPEGICHPGSSGIKNTCEKFSSGVPCYLYADGGRVVWDRTGSH